MTGWSIVTGASSGIGHAVSERLLASGRPVLALGRRAERLAGLAERHGSLLRVARVDVRETGAVEDAVGELAGDGVALLVNNAGLSLVSAPWPTARSKTGKSWSTPTSPACCTVSGRSCR